MASVMTEPLPETRQRPPRHQAKDANGGTAATAHAPAPPAAASPEQIGGRVWPPAPAKEDFWEWLSQFTADDWSTYLTCYLYRTAPLTDRRAQGKPINIRKYSAAFDQERIMLDEGSGGYRVDVTARDPRSGKSHRLCLHYFEILNMDYPPRVPAGDWVDDPANEVWKWAKGPIEQRAAQNAAAAAYPPGFDPNKMFENMLSGMRSLRGDDGGSGAVAAEMIKSVSTLQASMLEMNSPTRQVEMMKAVAALAPKPDDTVVKLLMLQLEGMREELKAARAERTAPAPSLLQQLAELGPALKTMQELLPRRSGEKVGETNWGDVITSVVEKVSDNLPYLVSLRGSPPQQQPGTAGFGGGFRLPPAAPTAQSPAANPSAERPAPESAAAAEAEGHAEYRARLRGVLDKFGGVFTQIIPFLLDHFRRGLAGSEFRLWLISGHGVVIWEQLKAETNPQIMFDLVQLHDYLRTQMQPPEKLREFFTSMYDETDEPDGDNNGEGANDGDQ